MVSDTAAGFVHYLFLLPSIMGVAYSFTDWNSRSVLNGVHFVELDNFKEILHQIRIT